MPYNAQRQLIILAATLAISRQAYAEQTTETYDDMEVSTDSMTTDNELSAPNAVVHTDQLGQYVNYHINELCFQTHLDDTGNTVVEVDCAAIESTSHASPAWMLLALGAVSFFASSGKSSPPSNYLPIARDDSGPLFTTEENTAFTTGSVLANDSDIGPPPDSLMYAGIVTPLPPGKGTLIDNGDGTYDFAPGTDFDTLAVGESEDISFEYRIEDSFGDFDIGEVTITIIGVNDPPEAMDDGLFNAIENGSAIITGNVLANDFDVEGATLAVLGFDDSGTLGDVFYNFDGTFTYTPNSNLDFIAHGQTFIDTFTYEVADPSGASDMATVSIRVTGVNDPPTIDPGQSFIASELALNTTILGTVLGSPNDDPPDFLQNFQIVGGNTDGIFDINPATGELIIADNTNLDFETTSQYNLWVQVDDIFQTSMVETVTIDIVDEIDVLPPMIISPDFITVEDGGTDALNVVATDPDTPPNGLTYSIVGGEDAGVFSLNPTTGLLSFDPGPVLISDASFDGDDIYEVDVVAFDGALNSDVQSIQVAVLTCGLSVTTTTDSAGVGTLRHAIDCANAGDVVFGQTDEIFLAPGTYEITFGSSGEDLNAGGDFDVTDDLIIQGAGSDKTFINGNDLDRIFHIHNDAKLILRDVTIYNGTAYTDGGGGIKLGRGEHLVLENSTVSGNFAFTTSDSNAWRGGGIDAFEGTIEIISSQIFNNTANGPGGGISLFGTDFTMQDSLLANNISMNGREAGGGLNTFVRVSNIDIDDSIISYNGSPHSSGGGLLLRQASVEINDTTIIHNFAQGNAGGIGNFDTSNSSDRKIDITNSTLGYNTANNGGAIYINSDTGQLNTFTDTTIIYNTANSGDGIYIVTNTRGGSTTLSNSIVSDNNDRDFGGGGSVISGDFNIFDQPTNVTIPLGINDSVFTNIGLDGVGHYGGATYTAALPSGNVAVDRGIQNLADNTDQRDASRNENDPGKVDYVNSDGTDVGAFELNFDAGFTDGSNADDTIVANDLDNTIMGLDGNDVIDALNGNDMVSGGMGNDIINGGGGDDSLDGGFGRDIIRGGQGNDDLTGGAGRDDFVFDPFSGFIDDEIDTVTDFEKNIDRLDLGLFTNILQHFDTNGDAQLRDGEFNNFQTLNGTAVTSYGFNIRVEFTGDTIILNNNIDDDIDLTIQLDNIDVTMLTDSDFVWL